MSDPDFDDVEGTEADAADLLEQAEPADAEPVEEALADRDRLVPGDPGQDRREREDAGEGGGGGDA